MPYIVNVYTGTNLQRTHRTQSPIFDSKEQAKAWAEFDSCILLPEGEFEWHAGDIYSAGICLLRMVPMDWYYVEYEVTEVRKARRGSDGKNDNYLAFSDVTLWVDDDGESLCLPLSEEDARLAEAGGYSVKFSEDHDSWFVPLEPASPAFKKYAFEMADFYSYRDCLTKDDLADIFEQGSGIKASSVKAKVLSYRKSAEYSGTGKEVRFKRLHPVEISLKQKKRGKVQEVADPVGLSPQRVSQIVNQTLNDLQYMRDCGPKTEELIREAQEVADPVGLSPQRVSQIAKLVPSREKAKRNYKEFYEAAAELGSDVGLPLRARNCLFRGGLLDAWPDIDLDDLQYIRNCGPKTKELIRKAQEIAKAYEGKELEMLVDEIYIERTDAESEKEIFVACMNEPTCLNPSIQDKGDGHWVVMVGWASQEDRDRFKKSLEERFPGWTTWR